MAAQTLPGTRIQVKARSVWSACDLSPLSGWPTCRPAGRVHRPGFGEDNACWQFGGDESPAESGDKSPHSTHGTVQGRAPHLGARPFQVPVIALHEERGVYAASPFAYP